MPYFDRFDICEAYAFYDMLWGPTEYGAQLRRIGFRLSPIARLETLDENAKAIFGSLVRKHNRLYVAYERFHRRSPNAPAWPGTLNMPRGDVRAWLKSQGILSAVESMVQE
jgi:hypothetical protein